MTPLAKSVWLATEPVDMRTGIDGLSLHVQQALGRAPCDGSAYVFSNRRRTRIKMVRQYAYHAEAKADVTDYIVGFYNCKRLNSVLGNLPPAAYERKMAKTNLSLCTELLDHCKEIRRTAATRSLSKISVSRDECSPFSNSRVPLAVGLLSLLA